jgi:phosphoribosylglycinamide formyltransferase-1
MAAPRLHVAVLASGSGSNLQALLDASARYDFGASIVAVISDRPGAYALERAAARGVPTEVVAWDDFEDRPSFTSAICDTADRFGAEVMALAGFMRVLSPNAIQRFPNRILNIHPALLPAFPGERAVADALEYGVKLTGVTVHFVDEQVDHGPIIYQEVVRVHPGDTASDLHSRIQEVEHRAYPEVLDALAHGRLRVEGRRVHWEHG